MQSQLFPVVGKESNGPSSSLLIQVSYLSLTFHSSLLIINWTITQHSQMMRRSHQLLKKIGRRAVWHTCSHSRCRYYNCHVNGCKKVFRSVAFLSPLDFFVVDAQEDENISQFYTEHIEEENHDHDAVDLVSRGSEHMILILLFILR